MAGWDDVRRIALSLPSTVQEQSRSGPRWLTEAWLTEAWLDRAPKRLRAAYLDSS